MSMKRKRPKAQSNSPAVPPSVQSFLSEKCSSVEGAEVPFAELYAVFQAHLAAAGGESVSRSAFGKALTGLGYSTTRKSKVRMRVGLVLKGSESPVTPPVTGPVTAPLPVTPDVTVYDEHMKPCAPVQLSPKVREWWTSVVEDYTDEDEGLLFEEVHLRMLTAAGFLWDRAMQAWAILQVEGLWFQNHLGNPAAHPMVDVERRCLMDFTKQCRELGIDAPAE